MEILTALLSDMLSCWHLDLYFLEDLIDSYSLKLDIEDIRRNYWKLDNINILIYEAFKQIKDIFIEENKYALASLWYTASQFEFWEGYDIFTKYLDSSLRFTDDKVSAIYEKWRQH